MNSLLLAAAPFAPVDEDYPFEARQMQALSFAVHIPIVCFGIAFPAFVLLFEGLWLRTGDLLYRTIAKRWSKVMLALFPSTLAAGTKATTSASAFRCHASWLPQPSTHAAMTAPRTRNYPREPRHETLKSVRCYTRSRSSATPSWLAQ